MSKLLGNEKLGENIKRIRLSCGLTQEQTVAKLQLLGSPLSRSTYSLIEMGRERFGRIICVSNIRHNSAIT